MKTSRFFVVIGIVILLWNLMGVLAFTLQYRMDLAALARSDPYQAGIFAAMPDWVWAAYAVAVWAGLLGAILLLARKAVAVPLFALSVIAVIVQFGYSFLGTDMLAVKGLVGAGAFPAFIIMCAVAQFLYARSHVAKGTLR